MDEKLTRQEIIDKRLEHVGWKVDDPSMVSQEFDIYLGSEPGNVVREARSQYDGHQFADYLLLGKDATPLGVVEAKKTSKDAEVGQDCVVRLYTLAPDGLGQQWPKVSRGRGAHEDTHQHG